MSEFRIARWNDLAALKARGLQVMQVVQGPGTETILIVEKFIDPPVRTIPPKPIPGNRARRTQLHDIMASLIAKAEVSPGQPARRELGSGLRIDLMIRDGMVMLQISRLKIYPSDMEWITVLNHFPYDPPLDADPRRLAYGNRFFLQGSWVQPMNWR